jgi:hypothetical protein
MFWPRLKTIEQTADRTILLEKPLYLSTIIPFAFALVPIAAWIGFQGYRNLGAMGVVMGLFITAMFSAVALSGLVTSTFSISRASGTLGIKRQLLWWSREQEYSVNEILTVVVDRSIKGNRLSMQLRSGQVKRFNLYMVYAPLEAEAGMVNQLLHAARQSGA